MHRHNDDRPPVLLIGLALLGVAAVLAKVVGRRKGGNEDHPIHDGGLRSHEIVVGMINSHPGVDVCSLVVNGPGFIYWRIDSTLPDYLFSDAHTDPAIVFETNDRNFDPPEHVNIADTEVRVRNHFVKKGRYKYTVNLLKSDGTIYSIDPHIHNV